MMRVTNRITFEAKNDAEALRTATERLGKDAVILSSRPIKVGGTLGFFKKTILFITAGILEEDLKEIKNPKKEFRKEKERSKEEDNEATKERLVAFQKLLEIRQATEMKSQAIAPNINLTGDTYQPSVPRPQKISSITDIKGEVEQLSARLAEIMTKLDSGAAVPSEKLQLVDEQGDIFKKLVQNEMSEEYAKKLVSEYSREKREENFASWLSKKIKVASTDPTEAIGGRKIAFIGPTGVGKTTTIAKLAAIFSLWEHKKVLLLTSDTYRIAAVEQMRTYAKILSVPLEVVFEPDGINKIIANYEKTDIVLLDTAGRNQRDVRHLEGYRELFSAFKPDAIHLVLAANMKVRDMFDVIERVSPLNISHLIFTKLDETTTYGSLFDVADRLGKPFSFFTDGQNVPNDIEVASEKALCSLLLGS